jgi:hypothetical protein
VTHACKGYTVRRNHVALVLTEFRCRQGQVGAELLAILILRSFRNFESTICSLRNQ